MTGGVQACHNGRMTYVIVGAGCGLALCALAVAAQFRLPGCDRLLALDRLDAARRASVDARGLCRAVSVVLYLASFCFLGVALALALGVLRERAWVPLSLAIILVAANALALVYRRHGARAAPPAARSARALFVTLDALLAVAIVASLVLAAR